MNDSMNGSLGRRLASCDNAGRRRAFRVPLTLRSIPTIISPVMQIEFLGKLGAGAYGEAFHARDEVGRELAIKFFDGLEGETKDSALREARLLAQVSSPHVVQVIWVTRLVHPERGVECDAVVLELIEGETLSTRLRRVLEVGAASALGRAVLVGVEAFHSVGLVHGDLHLDNVLVSKKNRLKLIDPMGARTLGQATVKRSSGSTEDDVYAAIEVLDAILAACPDLPFDKQDLVSGVTTLSGLTAKWDALCATTRTSLVVVHEGGRFFTEMWAGQERVRRFDAFIIAARGVPMVLATRRMPCFLSTYRELADGKDAAESPREPAFVEVFHLVDPQGRAAPVELERLDSLDFRNDLIDVARYIRPAAVTPTDFYYFVGTYIDSGGAHGHNEFVFRKLNLETLNLRDPLAAVDEAAFKEQRATEIEANLLEQGASGADAEVAATTLTAAYPVFHPDGVATIGQFTTWASFAGSDRRWSDYSVSARVRATTRPEIVPPAQISEAVGAGEEVIGWTWFDGEVDAFVETMAGWKSEEGLLSSLGF